MPLTESCKHDQAPCNCLLHLVHNHAQTINESGRARFPPLMLVHRQSRDDPQVHADILAPLWKKYITVRECTDVLCSLERLPYSPLVYMELIAQSGICYNTVCESARGLLYKDAHATAQPEADTSALCIIIHARNQSMGALTFFSQITQIFGVESATPGQAEYSTT